MSQSRTGALAAVILAGALAGLLPGTAPAAAAEFCATLKRVLHEAQSDFTRIKGKSEGELLGGEDWEAKVKLPGTAKCTVTFYLDDYSYDCAVEKKTREEADAAFRQFEQSIGACFPRGKVERATDDKGMPRVKFNAIVRGDYAVRVTMSAREKLVVRDRKLVKEPSFTVIIWVDTPLTL